MHDLDLFCSRIYHLCVRKRCAGLILRQVCDRSVKSKVCLQEESVCLSLLSDHGKSMFHGLFCVIKVHQLISEVNTPRRPGADTEDRLQKFRTSCTDQSVQSEDLALPYIE